MHRPIPHCYSPPVCSGAGKDRAPTACLLVEGCLAECGTQVPSAEIYDTCTESLKLILQQLSTGACNSKGPRAKRRRGV